MTRNSSVIYHLDQESFNKDFLKDFQLNSRWENFIFLFSFFGVKSEKEKLIIQWPLDDSIQFTLILKLMSKIVQKNLIGTYNQNQKAWIIMIR